MSAATCFALTILKIDRGTVGYIMIGFGVLAGLLQWWYCRQEIAKGMLAGGNSIVSQLYGLVILTAFCTAPAIILGRVLTGQKIV